MQRLQQQRQLVRSQPSARLVLAWPQVKGSAAEEALASLHPEARARFFSEKLSTLQSELELHQRSASRKTARLQRSIAEAAAQQQQQQQPAAGLFLGSRLGLGLGLGAVGIRARVDDSEALACLAGSLTMAGALAICGVVGFGIQQLMGR
eukprot:COSAG01_NODE_446_length_16939_cov_19.753518_12_plen_150_part_00